MGFAPKEKKFSQFTINLRWQLVSQEQTDSIKVLMDWLTDEGYDVELKLWNTIENRSEYAFGQGKNYGKITLKFS